MSKIYKNKKLFALLIALFCFSIISILVFTNIFWIFQLKLSDNLYLTDEDNNGEVIVVGIDKTTLNSEEFKNSDVSSWSRSVYATALNNLNKYEPKVVVFDIIFFAEKDDYGDEEFINTLRNTKNVILASNLGVEFWGFLNKKGLIIPYDQMQNINPHPKFSNINNVEVGYNNIIQDVDDVVRNYIYSIPDSYQNSIYYSLAHKTVEKFLDKKIDSPLKQQLIKFSSFNSLEDIVSFVDLYRDQFAFFDPENFKDKIVLIGPHDIVFNDSSFTPINSKNKLNNIAIHKNAILTLLQDDFLTYETDIQKIFVILFICFISAFVFMFTKIRWSFLYLVTVATLYYFLTPTLFKLGIIPDVIHPYISLFSTFILTFIYRYFTEFREKTAIRNAFSKYVSPEIVNKISKNPELLKLGGESKEITVLFTDIVNFTSISESLTPENLVTVLNEYFSCMIDVIKDFDGTIDKLQGDSIMAFWGAPLSLKDMEIKACEASLNMRLRLDELMSEWGKSPLLPMNEKKPFIDFRCGISTGTAIVGNIGAKDRFEYTVIGDTVNLASRLEGANKKYGSSIIVSEFTFEKAKDVFLFRELDLIKVVGKTKPVKIYELIGKTDLVPDDSLKLVKSFNDGVSLYRQRKFDDAILIFKTILNIYPFDNPSKLYLQRCTVLKDFPPSDDWNGVFEMKSK